MDSFPHVETGAEAGDRLSLGTFLEFLDEASPEILPGHFSHRKLEHHFFFFNLMNWSSVPTDLRCRRR